MKLDIEGGFAAPVKACLRIREEAWKELSDDDRAALIGWLKAQIPSIRADPDRYGIPKDAPVYRRVRDNIVNMPDGAFIIFATELVEGKWIAKATVAESKNPKQPEPPKEDARTEGFTLGFNAGTELGKQWASAGVGKPTRSQLEESAAVTARKMEIRDEAAYVRGLLAGFKNSYKQETDW